MIIGKRIRLRPIKDEDWKIIQLWGENPDAFWGAYQRFQIDHIPLLRAVYDENRLLTKESAFLLVEITETQQIIGYVRYTLSRFPDADIPHPEIGFGISEANARGMGFAGEAVILLDDYLFSGYPTERLSGLTDVENLPAQRVLEHAGYQREGIFRRSIFRNGRYCDLALYGLLRNEWTAKK